jgi:hypothetical protein
LAAANRFTTLGRGSSRGRAQPVKRQANPAAKGRLGRRSEPR